MTKTEICNAALATLGMGTIKSHTGNIAPCLRWYSMSVRQMAAAHPWTFFRAHADLQPTTDGGNTYAIPADCINILHMLDPRTGCQLRCPHIAGDTIITEQGLPTIRIIYTRDPYTELALDSTEHDPAFPEVRAPEYTQASIYNLAYLIARETTGKTDAVAYALQLRDAQLTLAKTRDAQQDISNKQHPGYTLRPPIVSPISYC